MNILNPYKSTIFINSGNRTSGIPGNFTINLSDQIPTPNNYDQIVLLSASIPKSYYTIGASNTFTLTEGVQTTTITIPQGNYDAISLASAIATLLSTNTKIIATYTATFATLTGKITFVTSSATATSFTFNNALAYNLGFLPGTYSFTAKTLVPPNVVNIQFTSTITITCNAVAGKTNILAQIVPQSGNFAMLTYNELAPAYSSKPMVMSSSSSLSFTLLDEYNNVIDLNGVDCQMTIAMYKLNQTDTKLLTDKRLELLENKINSNI